MTLRDELAVGLAVWATVIVGATAAWLGGTGPAALVASVTGFAPVTAPAPGGAVAPVVTVVTGVAVVASVAVAGVVARAVLAAVDDPAERLRAGGVPRVTLGCAGAAVFAGVTVGTLADGETVVLGVSLATVLVPADAAVSAVASTLVAGGVVAGVAAFAVSFRADRAVVARARVVTPPARRLAFDARRRPASARQRALALVTAGGAAAWLASLVLMDAGPAAYLVPVGCGLAQVPTAVRGRRRGRYEVTDERLVTPLGSVAWTAVADYRVTPTAVTVRGADWPVEGVTLDRESVDDEAVIAALDRHLQRPGGDGGG